MQDSERVGRYQLLELFGSGPNGTVSRAKVFGVAGFERQFAVKRFQPELTSTPSAAQSLSAAARAYGSLEHPRIARMSEFGVAQGQTFTAVELVVGLDAGRLVAEAKLGGTGIPAGGALALVSQAARAVGYAHGRGLSHLGLAPTNVIVTADGDVKVTDFGILASTITARPVDTPRLAQRIGYLAPEQLSGESTSAATDVFVLGVIAYELVTGQRAYYADSPQSLAQAILAGPPSEPNLPRPIVRVLSRCLARSQFERFPDARAFADALDAALRVAPVPGTRKDIGAQVKSALDRHAAMNEGQLSGVVAINVSSFRPPSEMPRGDNVAPPRESNEEIATTNFVRPDVPVDGPAPLVGPNVSAPTMIGTAAIGGPPTISGAGAPNSAVGGGNAPASAGAGLATPNIGGSHIVPPNVAAPNTTGRIPMVPARTPPNVPPVAPRVSPANLAASQSPNASTTMPEMQKPMTTVPGLVVPPPIPVPPGVAAPQPPPIPPPVSTQTILGVQAMKKPQPQVPPVPPRGVPKLPGGQTPPALTKNAAGPGGTLAPPGGPLVPPGQISPSGLAGALARAPGSPLSPTAFAARPPAAPTDPSSAVTSTGLDLAELEKRAALEDAIHDVHEADLHDIHEAVTLDGRHVSLGDDTAFELGGYDPNSAATLEAPLGARPKLSDLRPSEPTVQRSVPSEVHTRGGLQPFASGRGSAAVPTDTSPSIEVIDPDGQHTTLEKPGRTQAPSSPPFSRELPTGQMPPQLVSDLKRLSADRADVHEDPLIEMSVEVLGGERLDVPTIATPAPPASPPTSNFTTNPGAGGPARRAGTGPVRTAGSVRTAGGGPGTGPIRANESMSLRPGSDITALGADTSMRPGSDMGTAVRPERPGSNRGDSGPQPPVDDSVPLNTQLRLDDADTRVADQRSGASSLDAGSAGAFSAASASVSGSARAQARPGAPYDRMPSPTPPSLIGGGPGGGGGPGVGGPRGAGGAGLGGGGGAGGGGPGGGGLGGGGGAGGGGPGGGGLGGGGGAGGGPGGGGPNAGYGGPGPSGPGYGGPGPSGPGYGGPGPSGPGYGGGSNGPGFGGAGPNGPGPGFGGAGGPNGPGGPGPNGPGYSGPGPNGPGYAGLARGAEPVSTVPNMSPPPPRQGPAFTLPSQSSGSGKRWLLIALLLLVVGGGVAVFVWQMKVAGEDNTVATNDGSNKSGSNKSGSNKSGSDSMSGKSGSDSMSGKSGSDSMSGKSGSDSMSGKSGSDSMSGKSGSDGMSGKSGSDSMSGKSGSDSMSGKSGSDSMSGKSGSDSTSGKSGSDSTSGKSGSDSTSGKSGSNAGSGANGSNATGSGGDHGKTNGKDTPQPTGTSDALQIASTPAGARVFIDGADQGTTPVKLPGSADRHSMALLLAGHELYVAEVDGHGSFQIPMKAVTPTGGPAGIKVIKCIKDRYYVFVDGKPTGMMCPTERIDCNVGAHVVEVYDVVTETRRKWDINVTDTRLSYRVRVE